MATELKVRAARGVGWSFIDRTVTKAVALVVFLALARMLSPADFGLVAMAKAILSIVRPLLDQGTGPAIVQRARVDAQHRDSAFWLNSGAGAAIALLLALLAAPISTIVGERELRLVLGVMSVQFVIEGLGTTHSAMLERQISFKPLAVSSLVAEIAGGIVGITMALGGLGLWSLIGQTLSRQTVDTLMLWILGKWKPVVRFSLTHTRELLAYGYRAMGWRLAGMASERVDEILVGALLGATELGLYSVGLRIIRELRNLFAGSVGVVAFPTFSRLQADRKPLVKSFYKATEYAALLAIPTYLGLMVTAPLAIPKLVGVQWESAVPVVRALAITGIAGVLGGFSGSLIAALGRPAWNTWRALLDLGLAAAAVILLAPLGLEAVAIAIAISSVVTWPIGLLLVNKLLGLSTRRYLQSVGVTFVAALAMMAILEGINIVWSSRIAGASLLATQVFAGAASYAALVTALRPRYIREVSELVLLAVRKGSDGSS